MFPVLHTPRLVIRPVRPDDVDPLFERRNDPQVAELQAWDTPYPRERAESIVAEVLAMDGPVDGQWFMATVVEAATGEVVGDLVMHPTNELRTAEVGYSLSTRHWGKGYAAEALEAFVAWILEALPVTRLAGCCIRTTGPRRWSWSGPACCTRATRGCRSGSATTTPMTGSTG